MQSVRRYRRVSHFGPDYDKNGNHLGSADPEDGHRLSVPGSAHAGFTSLSTQSGALNIKLARIAFAASVFWGVISTLLLIGAVVAFAGNLGRDRTPVVLAEYGAKFLFVAVVCWTAYRLRR